MLQRCLSILGFTIRLGIASQRIVFYTVATILYFDFRFFAQDFNQLRQSWELVACFWWEIGEVRVANEIGTYLLRLLRYLALIRRVQKLPRSLPSHPIQRLAFGGMPGNPPLHPFKKCRLAQLKLCSECFRYSQ